MSLKWEVNKKCINEEKNRLNAYYQISVWLSEKKNKVDPNFIPYFEMINALNEKVKL